MPEIVTQSIIILANGGLGMATFSLGMKRHHQFPAMTLWTKTLDEHEYNLVTLCLLDMSLGLFMASRPSIIACGTRMTMVAMGLKFIAGPAVMALSSFAIGLRGRVLRVAIVQVHAYILLLLLLCNFFPYPVTLLWNYKRPST